MIIILNKQTNEQLKYRVQLIFENINRRLIFKPSKVIVETN